MKSLMTREGHLSDLTLERFIAGEFQGHPENAAIRAHLDECAVSRARYEALCAHEHEFLSTFGVGKEHSKGQWQAIYRQMMGLDLMRPDAERHGALVMTDRALPILRGEEKIQLRKDVLSKSQDRRPAVRAMGLPIPCPSGDQHRLHRLLEVPPSCKA